MTLIEQVEKLHSYDVHVLVNQGSTYISGKAVLLGEVIAVIDRHEREQRGGMTLREQLLALQCPPEAHAPTYVKLLANVLSIIDNGEKPLEIIKLYERENGEAGYAHVCAVKPIEDRPARDALFKSDCYSNDARALGFRAIIEAIDANTAAIREASK